MPKADAEHWDLPAKFPKQVDANARILRCARPRRDLYPFRSHGLHFLYRDLIVAAHHNFCAQFAQILHQVVGEGIVIVEDENHLLSDYISLKKDEPRRPILSSP